MLYDLDEEFNMRLKHNFKLSVLITSRRINWKQEDILESLYRLNGYKSHKTVKYEMNSSHIHVKFEEENLAREAVYFLNSMSTDLTAVLVDDMLRDWFNYEMKSAYNPPCTLTIVDIIGSPPLALNFLTKNILKSIFQNFGDPYLVPYTAALNKPHVQVLFRSMSEALAACMAFGEWYYRDQKVDSFFYRVRINPSDKEAMLIRNSGGIPKEAFKLDYFINVRNEVIQRQKVNEPDNKQKIERNKFFQNKALQKNRKQKLVAASNTETNENIFAHQVAHRTPILCVPVIAPLNSYAEALMASGKKLNRDFANTILNIRQTCAVSTKTVIDTVDSEINFSRSVHSDYADRVSSCNEVGRLEHPAKTLEDKSSDPVQISVPEKIDLIPTKQMYNHVVKQKRGVNKGATRMSDSRK